MSKLYGVLAVMLFGGSCFAQDNGGSPGWVVLPIHDYAALRTKAFPPPERTAQAPVQATLKKADGQKHITATVDRESLWEAQTPQVFRRSLLVEAYAKRGREPATDDAQLIEKMGKPVTIVPCSQLNVKITTRDDLKLAEQVLKVLPKPKLEGFQHPFADDNLWR